MDSRDGEESIIIGLCIGMVMAFCLFCLMGSN